MTDSDNTNPSTNQENTDEPDYENDDSWFVDITEPGVATVYFPDPVSPPDKPEPQNPA